MRQAHERDKCLVFLKKHMHRINQVSTGADDKTKKMASPPLSFVKWFKLAYKIRKKHDRLLDPESSTGRRRAGDRCDPSTEQRWMTWESGGKIPYMIQSSALWDTGGMPPGIPQSCPAGSQDLHQAFMRKDWNHAPVDDYAKDGGPGVVWLLCSFYHEPLQALIVKEVQ